MRVASIHTGLNSRSRWIFERLVISAHLAIGRRKWTSAVTSPVRKKDESIKNIIKRINDTNTGLCAIAERKMLQTIGGDCETAVGGLAEISNNKLILKVQLFSDEGDESFDYKFTGRDVDAANIGKTVGEKLLNLAGKKFKRR